MIKENDITLEASGISKSFPGVKALDQIDFSIRKGEVYALVGENGAGKSTLMKILSGIYTPDEGEGSIIFRGNTVNYQNPIQALNDGIILIHQELSLVRHGIAIGKLARSFPAGMGLDRWSWRSGAPFAGRD